MKYFSILLTLLGISIFSIGQAPEDSVKATITEMFLAMKNADTLLLKNTFAEGMILQTIVQTKDGTVKVQTGSSGNFVLAIGKLEKGDADEQISFETVKTGGALAMAWTPYKFFYKGKFSHCGVDSFQLVRINGQWRIQYIIDTRRKEGCN
jgi:hypothetical protein